MILSTVLTAVWLLGASTVAEPPAPVTWGLAGLLASGVLVTPSWAYRRERDEADNWKKLMVDKVLPIVAESTEANRSAMEFIKEQKIELDTYRRQR